ncbi:MAG: TetR/AcrR family transcriptional regulator [Lachnospiraceae bacterium]
MHDSYAEVQKKITKDSIVTALLKLLNDKNFSEITITQITKVAGVSRMAFYRNYVTKEDIISTYLDDMVSDFYGRFSDLKEHSKYDILCNFFSFFKERKAVIEILMDSGLIYIFRQKLNSSLLDFFKGIEGKNAPEYGTYFAQFEAGGLYNVLIEWVSNDTVDSVETMATLISEFTC